MRIEGKLKYQHSSQSYHSLPSQRHGDPHKNYLGYNQRAHQQNVQRAKQASKSASQISHRHQPQAKTPHEKLSTQMARESREIKKSHLQGSILIHLDWVMKACYLLATCYLLPPRWWRPQLIPDPQPWADKPPWRETPTQNQHPQASHYTPVSTMTPKHSADGTYCYTKWVPPKGPHTSARRTNPWVMMTVTAVR